MSRLLLIDGFNLAYRCFFATPELTRSDGFPTNALHGWVKSLWRLIDQEKPVHTVVFFDLGGSADRLALHPEYKAQRKEMPEALDKQIPHLKSITRLLGIATIEQFGVESDDLLASFAVQKAADGFEILIVSSDKDFAQIVNDKIQILLPPPSAQPKLGWRRLDSAAVLDKFGVPPQQIVDYLALIGDTSDNIPGITGVGPKTAVKWLQSYGNVEGVLLAKTQVQPERFRPELETCGERLRLNCKLIQLNLTLPTPDIEPIGVDWPALQNMLTEMEMKSTLTEAKKRYTQSEFLL